MVGVVGLLSVGALVLTLALSGQDDEGSRGGASVVVDSGYGPDDATGLDEPADPSSNTSGSTKAPRPAKPTTSASPDSGPTGLVRVEPSATPGPQKTAPAANKPPSATPTPTSVPGMRVFSHASQRCVDVVGGKAAPGAALMIWDCSGSASQRWTFPSDGTMRALGLCAEVTGGSTADGADLRMASCDGGAAQRITLNVRHDLAASQANKCLDVRDNLTSNGTRLQLWSCNGHDNQKWSSS
ncbi:ricin-type beta-trefoil lectin domain protein [Streptomyces sp. NPDC002463]|uniref:ricin-type beta-trefoil lectin domain protein n=1 Tax=Streptomyces sp. NPDC002463 TaxID=3364645 RepID=UPI00367BABF6